VYLTLDEAADYATERRRGKVSAAVLLRAGVIGELLVCASFGPGMAYNAITQTQEEIGVGFLVVPPGHLLEIETSQICQVKVVYTLDGEQVYFLDEARSIDQLRVFVEHLDRTIPKLLIDETSAEKRRKVNAENAKLPRQKTVDHEEVMLEFRRLIREGHTEREARGLLVQRRLASQPTIHRITKKSIP